MKPYQNILAILSIILVNLLIGVVYIKYETFQHNGNYLSLNKELTAKLALNINLNETLIQSELKFKALHKELSLLEHSTLDRFNRLIIKTDEILLTNKILPSLSNPDGCEPNRGLNKKHVQFDKSYSVQPKVFASITLIDFSDGSDHRLKLNIDNITTTGFDITLATWCNTKMSKVRANWMAFGY